MNDQTYRKDLAQQLHELSGGELPLDFLNTTLDEVYHRGMEAENKRLRRCLDSLVFLPRPHPTNDD